MISTPILLDTNLLVLFVVGTASPDYIPRHKRLSAFTLQDFEVLKGIIENAPAVLVTPNTLTETSNLAANIQEPARGEIRRVLQSLIKTNPETYIPSSDVAGTKEFLQLGLTNAIIVEASSRGAIVLTTDLDLYLATLSKGFHAVNFNHIRNDYL